MNGAVGAVQVGRDDTRRQTVVGVVGAADRFFLGRVGEDGHHRAEDLLAHDGHLVGTVSEHGRGHPRAVIKTFALQHVAAAQHARAFCFAFGDVAQHVVAVREADQRAKVGAFIEQIARADAAHALNDFLLKRCLNLRGDEHAGAVGAHLAGAEEVRHHGDVGREIEIRIVENNQRRFATQLHRHLFQGRARRVGHHFFAAGDAAGKGDFSDTRMFSEVLAGLRTHARQDVKHAVRQTRFGIDFGKFQGCERGHFARLEDHRVTCRQRRGGFPQGDLDRVVPRADARHYAQRFAAGIDE